MSSGQAPVPVITFLSDYGLRDEFVGVCHAVIARRCPAAHVIDLTHAIPRHDVRAGAIVLANALPYTPAGIHLAVVDPDVGAEGEHARRAVALRAAEGDRLLVGPDNGLLVLAAERLGGVLEAVDIGSSRERLQPVARTFHGRDIFAPVAAALAAGKTLSEVGEPLALERLTRLAPSLAVLSDGALATHVLYHDHFGNLVLDAAAEQIAALGIRPGERLLVRSAGASHRARYAATFADVPPGELLLYQDAQGMLALAVNRGSAAELIDARGALELLAGPA